MHSVEEFAEQTRLNPQELLQAIKTRRSIRQFTKEPVTTLVIGHPDVKYYRTSHRNPAVVIKA